MPLATAWNLATDLGHGWAAPLLMGYLWWERWGERPPWRPRPPGRIWWLGAGCAVALALPLRLFLTPFPLWPALVWAYILLLCGLALAAAALLAGREGVRWLGGPLVILPAALPWGNEIEMHLVHPLREAMAAITAEASNILGRPAIAMGTGVRLGNAWVGIDEACGGIRSLEASIMLALFIGEWLRFSRGRRVALVGLGILAAVFGNFLRILFLSLRAGAGPVAFAAAHDPAGWLALAFSLVLTGLASWWWARGRVSDKRIQNSAQPPRSLPGSRAAVAWLAAVTAVLVLGRGSGPRLVCARRAGRSLGRPGGRRSCPRVHPDFVAAGLTQEAREMLLPDHYVAGTWAIGINSAASAFYIQWDKWPGRPLRPLPAQSHGCACRWPGCELEATLSDFTVPWSGGGNPLSSLSLPPRRQRLAVAFTVWDTSRGRPLSKADTQTWRSWFLDRWTEVREAREDQPAQVLSVAITGPEGETRLVPLLQQLIVSAPAGM